MGTERLWLSRKCSGLSIPEGARLFWTSLAPVTATYNVLAELCFPFIFPNCSHSSLCPVSDTGPLPWAHPTYQPSLGTLPSSYSSELFTPIGHLHSSPFKPWLVGRSMKAHCVWRTVHHENVFYYAMSFVQPVEMGGEHFLQRSKVPCIDNKARRQNTGKKINAKCKVTPTSQQAWEPLASQTRRTLRGFTECCFPPPKSGLRSLSTGRGSEETAQGHCKQHVRGGGAVNKTWAHGGSWLWNWRWQVRRQQGWCDSTAALSQTRRWLWQEAEAAAGLCCPNKPGMLLSMSNRWQKGTGLLVARWKSQLTNHWGLED